VEAALDKALSRIPADRHATAAQFAAALTAEVGASQDEAKSIVVLPFENLSPDPDQEYFSDGLTEEVISDLSNVESLRVISRSSAMTFKGTRKKVTDIARTLGVRYVLEGSVRKAATNLRITAQLIDATRDVHLWAEKFTGTLADVFEMQESVSRSIVSALKLTLAPEQSARLSRDATVDPRAYDCYLKARHDILQGTEASLVQAQRHLENGLAVVGENALLLTGLALVHFYYRDIGIRSDDASLLKARELTERVLELDPHSSLSHNLLGKIERFEGSLTKAITHFKRAADIDANDPENLLWLGWHLALFAGKPAAAIPLVDRSVELDPLNPVNLVPRLWSRWVEGRAEEAIAVAQEIVTMAPQFRWAHFFHAQLLARNSQIPEALNVIDQVVQDDPQDTVATACSILRYALHGQNVLALSAIDANHEYMWNDPESPVWAAGWCAVLQEREAALHWLQRAVDRGWINYPFFTEIDPFFTPIRSDGRFRELMSEMKSKWENFES